MALKTTLSGENIIGYITYLHKLKCRYNKFKIWNYEHFKRTCSLTSTYTLKTRLFKWTELELQDDVQKSCRRAGPYGNVCSYVCVCVLNKSFTKITFLLHLMCSVYILFTIYNADLYETDCITTWLKLNFKVQI